MKYKEEIEWFYEGALNALLQTEECDGYCVERISETRFRKLCARFFVRFECQLNALMEFDPCLCNYQRLGQEFVLTWNGHGSGFWDMYMDCDDAYSRLTCDLLTVPIHLAIDRLREKMGSISAGKGDEMGNNVDDDNMDALVYIEVPGLGELPLEYDRRWLKGLMDEWQPEFKRFVRRHIEMPRAVRRKKVKI